MLNEERKRVGSSKKGRVLVRRIGKRRWRGKKTFFDHPLNFRFLKKNQKNPFRFFMFKILEITLKRRHYCLHFTVHQSKEIRYPRSFIC